MSLALDHVADGGSGSMQKHVVFLATLDPINEHLAATEELTPDPGVAIVPGVSESPVQAQGANVVLFYHSGLVLDTEVTEHIARGELAPVHGISLGAGMCVVLVAGGTWVARLGRIRSYWLVVCPMALVGVLPLGSGRFLGHMHPAHGLLQFSLHQHELCHDPKLIVPLSQHSQAKHDVTVLRCKGWQRTPHGSDGWLVVECLELVKLPEISTHLVPEATQLHELVGLTFGLLGVLEGHKAPN